MLTTETRPIPPVILTTGNLRPIDRYVRAARAAGCPADQVRRFAMGGYVAQRKQLRFHAAARLCDWPEGPTEIGYGGARGPGKSHAALAQVALDDCQRQSGLKCLFLRNIGKAAQESFEDLIGKLLRTVPHRYVPTRGRLEFPNGSRVILGGFKNESDIDQYLGIEYDVIVLEETTLLSSSKYQRIKTSLRTSKATWRPRLYSTTNPGGVGHAWYKQRFIKPFQGETETETRFIPATVDDNKFINPEYRRTLDSLTGWLRRAWRFGDWDIAAGQFFTTFNREAHVIKPLVVIPSNWRLWLSMDYGFTHYTTIYLMGLGGDGELFHIDEHAERGWLVERHAGAVTAMLQRWGLGAEQVSGFVAGADVFSKRPNGATVAGDWARYGWELRPANDDRVNGAAEYLRRLGDVEAGIAPTMFFFNTCHRLIECIPSLEHDPHRPEDVRKVDTDEDGVGGDDPYDGSRYAVMEAYSGQAAVVGSNPMAGYRG